MSPQTDDLDRLRAALAERYRLERELGQGGMATVYLAHDLKHDRKVAIKVLRPELAAVIGAERFLREIKTIANLQHPHILGLIDSGQVQGTAYYVMPFVEGESLRDRLTREKQLPVADAVRLAGEVAGALDYAHRHGVIHRDIKPENVLLHDGRALVADFGIALAVSSAGGTRMTETGMSLGTPHYMSPEQAMGERDLDARSDVYALGIMTYEMLTGEPPFTGPTAQAIIAKVMTSTAEPVTTLRATTPPAVAAAVHQAIQRLPADRFPTAAAFASALNGAATVTTGPAPGARVAPRGRPGMPWTAALAIGAVIGAAAFVVGRMSARHATGPSTYDAALPDSAPMSFGVTLSNVSYGEPLRNLTVSSDGAFAVYTARQGDSTELWYRSLRTDESRLLPGTRGANAPRISPDGTRIAFLRGDRVMLFTLASGETRLLLDGKSTDALNWMSNTQLAASTDDGNTFNWIDPAGGTPRTRTMSRCVMGRYVPELHQLICSYNRSAILLDPDSGASGTIRAARPDGTPGELVAGTAFNIVDRDYLVYLTANGTLLAARYDPARQLASRPVTMLSGVRREAIGEGQFDIAANGTLLYAVGVDATIGRLVRLHQGGTPEPLPMESGDFQRYALSRDRRWVAVSVQAAGSNELRIYDLQNGQHFTWASGGMIRHPVWNADGQQLMYAIRDSTRWTILRGAPSHGDRPDTLLSGVYDPFSLDPTDWYDEHLALAQSWGGSIVTRFDPAATRPAFDTVLTGARFSTLSPNRKLILYQTLEGNRVMVTSFPVAGRQWQLASEGVEPLWLSGSEVLYRLGISWYLVRINPETGEPLGPPAFWGRDPRFSDTSGWSNRPSYDGGIIYVQGPGESGTTYLRVIPNWVPRMKAAVDSARSGDN
ncbi:MAG TPA: protein kinase [Gemmatimonadales bacterium]|nr:protein kinase [Gemmatimonadales bacterium]